MFFLIILNDCEGDGLLEIRSILAVYHECIIKIKDYM